MQLLIHQMVPNEKVLLLKLILKVKQLLCLCQQLCAMKQYLDVLVVLINLLLELKQKFNNYLYRKSIIKYAKISTNVFSCHASGNSSFSHNFGSIKLSSLYFHTFPYYCKLSSVNYKYVDL